MRVLVTGGAGFIGSRLAERLVLDGHDVVALDDLSTGKRDNVPAKAELVVADVAEPDFVKKLPAGRYDAVCHLAAQSSGEVSMEDPLKDFSVNAAATLVLSQWCLDKKVPRFLYASSMAAYGDAKAPVAETAPCVPLTQYGVSKLASEHVLRLAARRGLSVTSFRMFSVYGAGQNMANLKQGMVSIYLAYILDGVEVPVKGSLERFRDLVHVDDVVEAWALALAKPSTPSLEYNVGTGKPTRVRELLKALFKACGKGDDYPVKELPGTPGDQFGLYADVSRAKAELGFSPRVKLDAGLASMAKWAREQRATRTA
jgi:UDP-glucose 4-epimerase